MRQTGLYVFWLAALSTAFSSYAQFPLNKYSPGDSVSNTLYGDFDLADGQYIPFNKKSNYSHPYFGNGNWSNADIQYKGEYYRNQYVLFDLVSNFLYVGANVNNHLVLHTINQEEIDEFWINGHHFKPLYGVRYPSHYGFYEVIQEGPKASCYIDRRKIEETDSYRLFYDQRDKYLFYLNDNYYLISRMNSVLKKFPLIKKDLRRFIRANNLIIRKGRVNDLYILFDYINSIPAE